jgi:dTDP-4-amino-4,6-dideoxygalactose transaminase
MLLLQDEAAWRRAWSFKDHGKDWDAVYNTEHPPGFRWLHESFGTNWRLTEMQSAIGRIQLTKLNDWVTRRRANAEVLTQALVDQPAIRLTPPPAEVGHAYYKYYAFVEPERLKAGWSRDRIVQTLQEKDIPCMQGICPEVYREKAFAGSGFQPAERLPVAKALGETSLMLPVHPTLPETEVRRMASGMAEVAGQAARD